MSFCLTSNKLTKSVCLLLFCFCFSLLLPAQSQSTAIIDEDWSISFIETEVLNEYYEIALNQFAIVDATEFGNYLKNMTDSTIQFELDRERRVVKIMLKNLDPYSQSWTAKEWNSHLKKKSKRSKQ